MQNLALRRLRVSEVHHFVHEFVDNDEVVANGLLLELLEVLDEDLDEAMEEEDDLGGIGVPFRKGEHYGNIYSSYNLTWPHERLGADSR